MSALIDELYGSLNEELDAQEKKAVFAGGEFRITDQQAAVWAIRKIRQAREHEAEISATAQAEMDRINSWLSKKLADTRGTVSRMEAYLHDYIITLQKDNPKLKSLDLPGARLQTTKRTKFQYDDAAVIAWARENLPDAINRVTKETLSKDAVKKHFQDTGEAIPGLEVAQEMSFSVKLTEEGEQANE